MNAQRRLFTVFEIQGTDRQSVTIVFLRYLAIWNIAVSHRVYEILSQSPEFFTAHQADRLSLALSIALLSFVAPASLAVLEMALGRVSEALGKAAMWAFSAPLSALGVIQLLRPIGMPGWLEVTLAFVGGVYGAVFLLRPNTGRLAVLALSPLILFSLAQIWFSDSIVQAVDSDVERQVGAWSEPNGTPVVLLVFDQLSTAAILRADHGIDSVRWPALRELARTATWYRNATTVSTETIYSVPALLTGKYSTDRVPPTLSAYPQNLFTFLGGSYSLNLFEIVTALAPDQTSIPVLRVVKEILSDILIIYGHLALPPEFRSSLAVIDGQPAFFGSTQKTEDKPETSGPGYYTFRRLEQIEDFVESLNGDDFRLSYLHHLNPHHPWQFTSSRRRYTTQDYVPGLESYLKPWPLDPRVADNARQRYLLQAKTVDTAIGRIVNRLKQLGIFDRSLLIVTADHGATFTPLQSLRQPTPDTYLDIFYVPLLIKYPGQTQSETVDTNAELVDVLPTIADALEVTPPPDLDGKSLLKPNRKAVKKAQSVLGGEFEIHDLPSSNGGEFSRIRPLTYGMSVSRGDSWIRPVTPCDDFLGLKREAIKKYIYVGEGVRVLTNADKGGYGKVDRAEYSDGWILGRLDGWAIDGEPLVTVSMDGRVREVVRTYSTLRTSNEFSVLLEEPLSDERGPVVIDILDPAHPRCGVASSAWRGEKSAGLDFSEADPPDAFGENWSVPEVSKSSQESWRWAIGPRADLFLPLPSEDCELRFRAWTHSENSLQEMTVKVDGVVVGTAAIPVDRPEWLTPIRVPRVSSRPKVSRIELEFTKWSQPPGGNDSRELAVAFLDLAISCQF